jgi:hypothetical protein
MATRRSAASKDKDDPQIYAAWETLCWCAAQHYRLAGELHTFAPRVRLRKKFIVAEFNDEDAIDEAIRRGLWDRQALLTRASYIMSRITDLIRTTKEADPRPSPPTRNPVINLTIDTVDGRKYIWNFAAVYAARRAVDFLISDRPTKWIDDNTLVINDKVTITTDIKPDGLSVIMEHEFTATERAWTLGADHMRIGQSMFSPAEPQWFDKVDKVIAQEKDAGRTPTGRKPKDPETQSLPRKPKVERPTGLVSLPSLLEGTDIDPKEARNALRKLGIEKPEHGRWEFEPKQADDIKSRIVKKVKELRK